MCRPPAPHPAPTGPVPIDTILTRPAFDELVRTVEWEEAEEGIRRLRRTDFLMERVWHIKLHNIIKEALGLRFTRLCGDSRYKRFVRDLTVEPALQPDLREARMQDSRPSFDNQPTQIKVCRLMRAASKSRSSNLSILDAAPTPASGAGAAAAGPSGGNRQETSGAAPVACPSIVASSGNDAGPSLSAAATQEYSRPDLMSANGPAFVGEEARRRENLGQSGIYVPDFAGVKHAVSGAADSVREVLALMGELEVVSIRYDGQRYKAVVPAEEDSDMQLDDSASATEADTHSSPASSSSAASIHMSTMFIENFGRKWQAGMAKAIVYSLTSYEYCNARLLFAIIHTKFSRVVLTSVDPVPVYALECSEQWLDGHGNQTLNMAVFLESIENAEHLAHDLYDSDRELLCYDTLSHILDIYETAMRQLTAGNFLPPYHRLSWAPEQYPTAVSIIQRSKVYDVKEELEDVVCKQTRPEIKRGLSEFVSAREDAAKFDNGDVGGDDDYNEQGSRASKRGKPSNQEGGSGIGRGYPSMPGDALRRLDGLNPGQDHRTTALRNVASSVEYSSRSDITLDPKRGVSAPRRSCRPQRPVDNEHSSNVLGWRGTISSEAPTPSTLCQSQDASPHPPLLPTPAPRAEDFPSLDDDIGIEDSVSQRGCEDTGEEDSGDATMASAHTKLPAKVVTEIMLRVIRESGAVVTFVSMKEMTALLREIGDAASSVVAMKTVPQHEPRCNA